LPYLAQAVERVRRTPGFAARAARAKAAYQAQAAQAAAAVNALADQHGLAPGQKLAWRHRPNATEVPPLLALQVHGL
jgi:hypothetical protein